MKKYLNSFKNKVLEEKKWCSMRRVRVGEGIASGGVFTWQALVVATTTLRQVLAGTRQRQPQRRAGESQRRYPLDTFGGLLRQQALRCIEAAGEGPVMGRGWTQTPPHHEGTHCPFS